MPLNYIKNPDEIYQRSFEIVQNEADLSRFGTEEAKVATRIIHASGMPEICNDLKFSPTVIKEPEKPAEGEAGAEGAEGETPAEGTEATAKDGEGAKKDDKAKESADKKPDEKKPAEKKPAEKK